MHRSITRIAGRAAAVCAVAAAGTALASPAAADTFLTQSTTLTSDVSGPVVIGADNITLDCAGHRITATGWAAVDLTDRTGVTVKNCHVGGATVGIWLNRSSGNRIAGNTANGVAAGVWLFDHSQGNVVTGNDTSGNPEYGIWIQIESNGNLVSGNVANGNLYSGIFVIFASHNTLTGNTANGNGGAPVGPLDAGQGFYLFGANANTLTGNTATGNVSDGFQLRGSSANTLTQDNGSTNGRNGFGLFEGSNGNTLADDTSSDGRGAGIQAGFWLQDSSDNSLARNTANDNRYDGLIVINAHGSTRIADSTGNGNGAYGFDANRCTGVTFANDSAARNTFGGFFNILSSGTTYSGSSAHDNGGAPVGPLDQGEGFYLYETDSTTMTGNLATSNDTDGFQLRGATHTLLRGNKSLANDRIGFGLFADDFGNQSTGNTVDSNLGRGNGVLDAQDTSPAGSNIWTNNNFGTS
jgi:trimeric autotransporter adhesin